jgi:ATP-binding cassette, subfamily B, bacterial
MIESDGDDLRNFDLESWRSRITAVFQDFIRFKLPLRDNVAPTGAPDCLIHEVLAAAGAKNFASLAPCFPKRMRAERNCQVASGSALP